jgi:hypothetical protein
MTETDSSDSKHQFYDSDAIYLKNNLKIRQRIEPTTFGFDLSILTLTVLAIMPTRLLVFVRVHSLNFKIILDFVVHFCIIFERSS